MILVTGATGLVGSYIIKALLHAGHAVRALLRSHSSIPELLRSHPNIQWVEGDILDPISLQEALESCQYVIHAAGLVSYDPKDKERLFEVNVEGTANLVNACLAGKVNQLVHISSIAAIGRQKGASQVNETQVWEPSSHNTYYAKSKQAAEMEVWRGQAEGLAVTVLNPSVVLANNNLDRSSGRLLNYVIEEKPFFIHGVMNWVDARDLAQLIVQTLGNPQAIGERFIVSAGCLNYQDFFIQLGKTINKRPPYIGVGKLALHLASAYFKAKRLVSSRPSLITSETAKLAGSRVCFSQNKVVKAFNFQFRPLQETLDWINSALKNTNSAIN